ncbi:hypothetical protein ACFPAG_03250 [Vogesella sp. GCM10023246]|uniref:Uncharacterized protein n=1 Tax=Vogesella oryzagri TaxID=3160864 RepID=A0ABV1M212_9NEIS
MSKFASKSSRGFYSPDIHGEKMPADVVAITDEQYDDLITAQSAGKLIDWSGDMPLAVDPPPLTVLERRRLRLLDINMEAARSLSVLSSAYPAGEVQSWPQQTREAELLAADPQALAPLLTAIAAARGLSVAELASRVQAKVQAYAMASGQIIGRRQALEDALMAVDLQAPDAAEQLEGIKWAA